MRKKSSKVLVDLYFGDISRSDFLYLILSLLLISQLVTDSKNLLKIKDYYKPVESYTIYVYANPFQESKAKYDFSQAGQFFRRSKFNYTKKYDSAKLEKSLVSILPNTFKDRAALYIKPILSISHEYNIDPLWVLSVIWTESHFKAGSTSKVGARGLMQLMPKTKKYLLAKYKGVGTEFPYEIKIPYGRKFYQDNILNIELGVIYLKKLLKRFRNPRLATVAYNMGPTWTSRRLYRKLPVGNKNVYLNKVSRAYRYITRRL